MTSLPISNHKPQSSSSAASALPGNTPADSLATDTPTIDARPADPFAFLLAQQIGATDLSALEAAPLSTIPVDDDATDGNTSLPLPDAQGLAAIAKPDDPTGIVAAILQQLAVPEDKGRKIALQQTAGSFAINALDKTDGSQATRGASPESGRSSLAAALAGDQTMQNPAIDNLSSAAFNRAGLASSQTQPAQSGTQALVSPPGYATMPGTIANNVAPVTPTVTTPVGHQGWANEFSQKISWISTQQNQIAQLHLNPPNLGPLDVVLKISGGEATALFASPHAAVREAVENALPKLREILADNGIMLGNTTVSDQSPRDRSSDGFMNQSSGTAAQPEVSSTMSEQAGVLQAAAPAHRHNGMVDTFA